MHALDPITEYAREPVKRPVMFQAWKRIAFLHWCYQPDVIGRLVPQSLQPDTFDGAAWVGLTPFLLTSLRPPWLPVLPWLSRFPEMNVRTYVIGPDGGRGIWFFSLEADRLPAVIAARIAYGLPYRWASMNVSEGAGTLEYTSRRHFGKGSAALAIQTGPEIHPDERDRFLTARFRLYTLIAGRLAFTLVEHEPWPLRTGKVLRLEQDVILHSGVPAPEGEPLVHFSPGVYARIGMPAFVRRSAEVRFL